MHRALVASSLACLALSLPAAARAAEGTEIASAEEVGTTPHVHVSIDYYFEAKRAAIKREFQGNIGSTMFPDGVIPTVKDLRYKQNRHVITPRISVGFYDVEMFVGLPIVLSDTRELGFDQSDDPCVFPPDPDPTCVDRNNSRTLQDDLLPGKDGGTKGYDADDPTTGFAETSKTVFRGVNRSGIDQIHMGLNWAVLNQARDDTKPTWVIGVEYRRSIGKIMKFNRLDPGAEDGVSQGFHEFRAHTAFSKRTTWAEPYVDFWWQTPVGVRGDNPTDNDSSLFWDVGFGQENKVPQQQAGVIFGLEAYVWERLEQKQKLTVQLEGHVASHFEGRGYSEMWEVFQFAGDPDNPVDPSVPCSGLILDSDPVAPGCQALQHPGVTDIENYLSWGARMGVRGQIGARARFTATFMVGGDQRHIISFTDAGRDDNDNGVVDPDSAEENPLHKAIIDTVGHRYIVDETLIYTFFVNGTLMI